MRTCVAERGGRASALGARGTPPQVRGHVGGAARAARLSARPSRRAGQQGFGTADLRRHGAQGTATQRQSSRATGSGGAARSRRPSGADASPQVPQLPLEPLGGSRAWACPEPARRTARAAEQQGLRHRRPTHSYTENAKACREGTTADARWPRLRLLNPSSASESRGFACTCAARIRLCERRRAA